MTRKKLDGWEFAAMENSFIKWLFVALFESDTRSDRIKVYLKSILFARIQNQWRSDVIVTVYNALL